MTNNIWTVLVHTVDNNKSNYSLRLYYKALQVHKLQDIIGRPSTHVCIKVVEGNMIPSCPITKEDIIRAENIFGTILVL